MIATLTFDHATHTYEVGGKVLPSVTQIVNRVIPRQHYADEWYLRRGSMVHKAIAMHLNGNLDWPSLDPRILGYVRAADRCLAENFPNWREDFVAEMPLPGGPLGYAGTFDLLTGGKLIDWKCSDTPATEVQLGGYVALIEHWGKSVRACVAVELSEAGTYKTQWYKPARCKALFLAALSIYGWMKENKINEKEEGNGTEPQ